MGEGMADIARDHRCVVEVVEKAAAIFGKDNLLFGPLDGGCKV